MTTAVRRLQVFQVERALHLSLFQLRVHRREPTAIVVPRIARLGKWREIQHEARTHRGKPRLFDLFCQGEGRTLPLRWLTILRMWFRPRGVDMIVHVDANGPGHHLRNARINPIGRRMQPCRPEQHGAAGAHSRGQEFPSRKVRIARFRHTAHGRAFAGRRLSEMPAWGEMPGKIAFATSIQFGASHLCISTGAARRLVI